MLVCGTLQRESHVTNIIRARKRRRTDVCSHCKGNKKCLQICSLKTCREVPVWNSSEEFTKCVTSVKGDSEVCRTVGCSLTDVWGTPGVFTVKSESRRLSLKVRVLLLYNMARRKYKMWINVEGRNQCSHCCCQTAKLLVVFQIVCHLCSICCVILHFCTCCDSLGLRAFGTKKYIFVLGSKFHTPDLFRVKLILSKPWRQIWAIEVHLHSFPQSALQRGLSFTHRPLYP